MEIREAGRLKGLHRETGDMGQPYFDLTGEHTKTSEAGEPYFGLTGLHRETGG